jgi:hypothetical protein
MEEEFKLKDDGTMRRLRAISQSPHELAWRIELLSTLERMRIESEVSTRSILQTQARLERSVAHLTPTKLASLINAQIDEKLKPLNQDSKRIWRVAVWSFDKAVTVCVAVLCAMIGLKGHK